MSAPSDQLIPISIPDPASFNRGNPLHPTLAALPVIYQLRAVCENQRDILAYSCRALYENCFRTCPKEYRAKAKQNPTNEDLDNYARFQCRIIAEKVKRTPQGYQPPHNVIQFIMACERRYVFDHVVELARASAPGDACASSGTAGPDEEPPRAGEAPAGEEEQPTTPPPTPTAESAPAEGPAPEHGQGAPSGASAGKGKKKSRGASAPGGAQPVSAPATRRSARVSGM